MTRRVFEGEMRSDADGFYLLDGEARDLGDLASDLLGKRIRVTIEVVDDTEDGGGRGE